MNAISRRSIRLLVLALLVAGSALAPRPAAAQRDAFATSETDTVTTGSWLGSFWSWLESIFDEEHGQVTP